MEGVLMFCILQWLKRIRHRMSLRLITFVKWMGCLTVNYENGLDVV
jgi:hypothetical protein